MIIKDISFKGFRNLLDTKISVSDNINIILGDNAQGKTNFLECIWLFNGVRSFRGSKDNELISFYNKDKFAKIDITFFADEREQTATIEIIPKKRQALLNGIKKKSTSNLIGKCTSVVFSPDNLTLVKNGPAERRRFLDGALCRLKLSYAVLFSKYNRVIHQRNMLLKNILKDELLKNSIEVWDEQVINIGAKIIFERLKYVKMLENKAKMYQNGLSSGKENLKINYISNCKYNIDDDIKEIENKLRNSLKNSLKDDLYTLCTNTGPHRDDIDILINEVKSKMYASQGQQRSIVLALKLSEADIFEDINEEKPIILLDDVLSELDNIRQNFLINNILDRQVFITCCDLSLLEKIKKGNVFIINNGEILKKEI